MKKLIMVAATAIMALAGQAQENKYIVKTKNAVKTVSAQNAQGGEGEAQEEEKAQDFLGRYFRYVSLCDWKEGMRFMVIPDKKDMVIKTFADASTGQMVSSMRLRHKIMVYKGHEDTGGLHERINFVCEDDGKAYYYEIPTASFDDYCFGKLGVPTLAYLGDVDTAIEMLKDKVMYTMADEYYIDTEVDGDGFQVVTDVPVGTEVKVVAVGVGTRNYPVKIIVADKNGREFFQNVAISRTNSGMRDDEFDISSTIIHTFKGAFELPADNMAVSDGYSQYVGKKVYTLYDTDMYAKDGQVAHMPRFSAFTIKEVYAKRGTDYVTLVLTSKDNGALYSKEVTFRSNNVAGDIADEREDLFSNLFADGDPSEVDGVRQGNMADIKKGNVRAGFTEAEVRLAFGEPTARGEVKYGTYTWEYKRPGKPYMCVYFNPSTKKVTRVQKGYSKQ